MKDIFKKMASLVVDVNDDTPVTSNLPNFPDPPPPVRKTIAELVKEAPGPNLDEVHVPVSPHPVQENRPVPSGGVATEVATPGAATSAGPVVGQDGKVDINAIYLKANLPPVPFTAEQAYDMIHSLPAELPLEIKRQTVKVMLSSVGKTLGFTPETVVMDAARKVAAMHSFIEGMTKQSEAFVTHLEGDIQSLEAKIQEARSNIKRAQDSIATLTAGCSGEAVKLNEMAEFFRSENSTQGLPGV